MWGKLRILSPAAGLPILFGGLLVMLVVEPWDSREATGVVTERRFCNTVLQLPEDTPVEARLLTSRLLGDGQGPVLQISVTHPGSKESGVVINPMTGELVEDRVDPADRLLIDSVLATKRVDQSAPAFWPYTDRTQIPAERFEGGVFGYRYPDPGAGLLVLVSPSRMALENCRSSLVLAGNSSGGVDPDYSDVMPEDRAPFEAFAATVTYQR